MSLCAICGSENLTEQIVQEMMLGTRHQFRYYLCSQCRCLQIAVVPQDISKYYPEDTYYSFRQDDSLLHKYIAKKSFQQRGPIYNILNHYLLTDPNLVAIGRLNLPAGARILDVGSGAGLTLARLKSLGYTNVTGIDPYIHDEISHPIRIVKLNLDQFEPNSKFDLIMFLHSLEHTTNPIKTLACARDLLEDNGTILVRTPIVSYAFQRYGSFWFQIDAPRHIFVFSEHALWAILKKLDMSISDLYYDSSEDQFVWSERYEKDISKIEQPRSIFDTLFRKVASTAIKKARVLNKEKRGDQAVFYINKQNGKKSNIS